MNASQSKRKQTRPGARLNRLGRLIAGSSSDAHACARCQERLADYVEAESEGHDAAARYPDVRRHLEGCLACQQVYADQLSVTRREINGTLAPLTRVPHFDLGFLPAQDQTPAAGGEPATEKVRAVTPEQDLKQTGELEEISSGDESPD